MSADAAMNPCKESENLGGYLLQALSAAETAALEAHLATCASCQRELAALKPIVDSFAYWPTNVLRPPADLQLRLAERVAAETGGPAALPDSEWKEPPWEEVAPGIFCQLLARDSERHRISMLVRLIPGAEYPPHTHAGVEELHLLDGELWINGQAVPGKLQLRARLHERQTRVERNRLHLRADHEHEGSPWLMWSRLRGAGERICAPVTAESSVGRLTHARPALPLPVVDKPRIAQ